VTVYNFLLWFSSPLVDFASAVWTIDSRGEILFAAFLSWWAYVTAIRFTWTTVGRWCGFDAPDHFAKWLRLSPPWRRLFLAVMSPIGWYRRQLLKRGMPAASWASLPEVLARWVFRRGKGIVIGTACVWHLRLRQPLAYNGKRNLNFIGDPGVGKTATFGTILGTLHPAASALYLDVDGDLTRALGAWIAKYHPFVVFDLNHLTGLNNGYWNLLDEFTAIASRPIPDAKDDTPEKRKAQVGIVARAAGEALIVQENHHQPVWDNGGRDFLVALLVFVWLWAPTEKRNLRYVRQLLCCGLPSPNPKISDMNFLFFTMEEQLYKDDGAGGSLNLLIANGAATMRGNNSRDGENHFLSSARRHTAWLDLEPAAEATSRSGFLMSDLKTSNLVVSIVAPVTAIKTTYQPFIRLLFTMLGYTFENMGHARQTPAIAIVDEAQNLGPLGLVESGPYMRKYGLQVVTGLQDISGLSAVYPKTFETILSTAGANVFMGTTNAVTLQWLSQRLDKTTVRVKVEGTPGWARPFTPKNEQIPNRYQKQIIDLMTPEQLKDTLTPTRGRMVVLNEGRPFIAAIAPYWKSLPVWRYQPVGYPETILRRVTRRLLPIADRKVRTATAWLKSRVTQAKTYVRRAITETVQTQIALAFCAALTGGLAIAIKTDPVPSEAIRNFVGLAAGAAFLASTLAIVIRPLSSARRAWALTVPEAHAYSNPLALIAAATLLAGMGLILLAIVSVRLLPDLLPMWREVTYAYRTDAYIDLAVLGIGTAVVFIAFLLGFAALLNGGLLVLVATALGGSVALYRLALHVVWPAVAWCARALLSRRGRRTDAGALRRALTRWLEVLAGGAAPSRLPNSGEGQ
jgi:type IV secretory pathway TraG/TraD family ATPase VirD4